MDHVIDEWKRWGGARNKPARGEQSKFGERQLHPLYRVTRFRLPVADVSRMSTCILHVELFCYSCY